MDTSSRLINVYSTSLEYQAEIVKDILQSADIEAMIVNKKDSAYKIGMLEVCVHDRNEEEAVKIIKTIDFE